MALAAVLSACGSSGSSSPSIPTVAPAKTFKLAGFQPGAAVRADRPVEISFHIVLPSGKTLTRFKTGAGPHTGVHLIIVRNDLSAIVHRHPKVAPDGTVRQSVTFPAPGKYHVLVDVYPVLPDTPQLVNFQLTETATVSGTAKAVPLPAYRPEVTVGGYHVQIEKTPKITALEPAFVTIRIRDANGTRAAARAVLRGARARDLLPRRLARVLPHAHLRALGARAARASSAAAR